MATKKQVNAYKIIMSRGNAIQIDADEMAKVVNAMQNGKPCKVRQGLFNPSFYVEIVEDTERLKEYREEVRRIEQSNHQDRTYGDGKHQREIPEFKPLKNIFAGVSLQLESSTGNSRLKSSQS